MEVTLGKQMALSNPSFLPRQVIFYAGITDTTHGTLGCSTCLWLQMGLCRNIMLGLQNPTFQTLGSCTFTVSFKCYLNY